MLQPTIDSATSGVVTDWKRFASIAVLDLETSNLPAFNFNKAGITELSIYGFSVAALKEIIPENGTASTAATNGAAATSGGGGAHMPPFPRVMHKLTLMLNPRMMVDPVAAKITGLNNYMLEDESAFDENAGNTLLSFVQHLQQPVCLVAHNGWNFDFPLVKQALDKLQMHLPSNTLCVDSLRAFHEIDIQREIAKVAAIKTAKSLNVTTTSTTTVTTLTDTLWESTKVDWRACNENTPKRSQPSAVTPGIPARVKRPLDVTPPTSAVAQVAEAVEVKVKSRRMLFSNSTADSKTSDVVVRTTAKKGSRKYPPKGVYKLDNMFPRIFGRPPPQSHYAEADVAALTKLMLHYGDDFLTWTEEHAMPFSEVLDVGVNCNW